MDLALLSSEGGGSTPFSESELGAVSGTTVSGTTAGATSGATAGAGAQAIVAAGAQAATAEQIGAN